MVLEDGSQYQYTTRPRKPRYSRVDHEEILQLVCSHVAGKQPPILEVQRGLRSALGLTRRSLVRPCYAARPALDTRSLASGSRCLVAGLVTALQAFSWRAQISFQNEENWMQREQPSIDQEGQRDVLHDCWSSKEHNRKQDLLVQRIHAPEKSRLEHS